MSASLRILTANLFSGTALGIRGLIRFDHCFLSGLSALKTRVVPVRESDHLGLCVDVELPHA